MEFDRIIPLYMEDCHARQLRPKTMQSYEQALRLFSVWLEEHHGVIHIEGVTDYYMRRFIIDLQTRGKYTFCSVKGTEEINHPQNRRDYNLPISNITINNYLRNLRAFFAWLVEMEYLTRTPMKKIKLLSSDRRARDYLEDEEVVRLLKCLNKGSFPEFRDTVAIMIMLDSGTRVGETLSAEVSQLHLDERSLHLPADKTKGRKARTVFFSAKTARELRHWLQFKDRYCESDFIFPVKHSGFPPQVSDFEKNFAKYVRRAGIRKRVSPHTLRNNFAKRCILSGMGIYTLSRLLGHSSVEVTQQSYLDVTEYDLKQQYGKYSPEEGIFFKHRK